MQHDFRFKIFPLGTGLLGQQVRGAGFGQPVQNVVGSSINFENRSFLSAAELLGRDDRVPVRETSWKLIFVPPRLCRTRSLACRGPPSPRAVAPRLNSRAGGIWCRAGPVGDIAVGQQTAFGIHLQNLHRDLSRHRPGDGPPLAHILLLDRDKMGWRKYPRGFLSHTAHGFLAGRSRRSQRQLLECRHRQPCQWHGGRPGRWHRKIAFRRPGRGLCRQAVPFEYDGAGCGRRYAGCRQPDASRR